MSPFSVFFFTAISVDTLMKVSFIHSFKSIGHYLTDVLLIFHAEAKLYTEVHFGWSYKSYFLGEVQSKWRLAGKLL